MKLNILPIHYLSNPEDGLAGFFRITSLIEVGGKRRIGARPVGDGTIKRRSSLRFESLLQESPHLILLIYFFQIVNYCSIFYTQLLFVNHCYYHYKLFLVWNWRVNKCFRYRLTLHVYMFMHIICSWCFVGYFTSFDLTNK